MNHTNSYKLNHILQTEAKAYCDSREICWGFCQNSNWHSSDPVSWGNVGLSLVIFL